MAANQKCERLIDALINQLTLRGFTVAKAYDSGDVYVNVTAPSGIPDLALGGTLSQKALVRIKPVAGLYGGGATQTDGLALPQRVYNPLVAQFLYNTDVATNHTIQARTLAQKAFESIILAEVLKAGMVTELHTKDSAGGAMVVGDFGTVAATIVPEAMYPYSGQ